MAKPNSVRNGGDRCLRVLSVNPSFQPPKPPAVLASLLIQPGGIFPAMAGKAKPKKHTAKEIAGKVAAATTNKGGGKAGLADRLGGAAGHAKFKCPSCGIQSPSIKSAEMHWDSKHPKLPFKPEDWSDMHAVHGGVTTQGVAVKGSSKEKTKHELAKSQSGQQKLKELENQKAMAKFQ